MKEHTKEVATLTKYSDPPQFIRRDTEKHLSEKGAAINIRSILETLEKCIATNRRPPRWIPHLSLRNLYIVAEYLEEAAEIRSNNSILNECDELRYEKAIKNSKNALLECFGLYSSQGASTSNHNEIIRQMSDLLCGPLDEDCNPIGEPKCNTINQASKIVAKELGLSSRAVSGAWREHEKFFEQ